MIDTGAEVMNKSALRSGALSRRAELSPEERAELSLAIAKRANSLIGFKRPRCIAGYLPIRGECDPRPIMEKAEEQEIDLALPAIVDAKTIVFRRYVPGQTLVAGRFGTLAPDADSPLVEPDLIIVPVVGFDRSGSRLGYGRGFYDRAIAGVVAATGRRPLLLGPAFSVQEVERIPHEAHDIRLDWVVTEKETLAFQRNGG